MSDDDDFMMSDEEEDYDFDYDDDDDEGPQDMDQENMYYSGKSLREDDAGAAIEQFKKVIEKGGEDEWSYKATKQIIKVLGTQQRKFDDLLPFYQKMLNFPGISKSYAEKSLSNCLDRLATSGDMEFLQKVYAMALDALQASGNERLWIKTALKLLKLYVDREDEKNASKIAGQLRERCQGDSSMGTYLLELYSLEIQLCTLTNNNKRLKQLYKETMEVTTAIPHPRILGIIRECGGKMHMREGQWDLAREDFFESFKNYDEAGSLQRIEVLKFYVLACMLSESKINPFASQETKPYMNNPNVSVMVNLVEAAQSADIEEFTKIMKRSEAELMSDKFMRLFLDDVVRTVRFQALATVVKPYSRVSLEYLANELQISEDEANSIAVNSILDGKLPGARVNSVAKTLEFNFQHLPEPAKSSHLPERYSASHANEQKQAEQQSVVNSTSDESTKREAQLDRTENLTSLLKSVRAWHDYVHSSSDRQRPGATRPAVEGKPVATAQQLFVLN